MDDKTFDDPKTAQEWINTIESDGAKIRETDLYPRLKKWINHVNAKHILDIGSGQGICSDKIDLNGRHYTGLEPSPFLVGRAEQLYQKENRRFKLGGVYSLPFADCSFDAVFSVAVWHLLSDLKKAANELSRVLSAGGNFLIITANPGAYSLWTDVYTVKKFDGRRFEGKVQNDDQSVSHDVLYLHRFDEITGSLQAANLVVQETDTFRASEKLNGLGKFISIQGQKILL